MGTSAWFDYNVYMVNKLAEVLKAEPAANWDMPKLVKAFSDAGFVDAVGAEKHFEEYGQYEDVAPNAFFNATEYFRAKAAQFYDKDPKAVTDLEAAAMQLAIKDAGMSAWSHYEQFGNTEKVNPSNSFDTEAYMNAKLTALNDVKDGKQWTLAELNAAFKAAGLSALEHFMTYGGAGDGEVAQKIENGKIPAEFAVPEEKKVTAGGGSEGKTFVLTKDIDNIVGTDGDDLIIGDSNTTSAADIIDGKGGNNTLTLAGTTSKPTFTNIQNVVLDQAGVAFGFDIAGDTGVKNVTVKNVTMSSGDANLTVGAGQAVTLHNVQDTATDAVALNINAAGSVTSLDLNLNKAGNAAASGTGLELEFNAAGLKTLNVSATGNASRVVMIETATADLAIDKMVISGDQNLNWTMVDSSAAKVTIDGSAAKGNLTLTLAADDYALTGGAGDDTFIFGSSLTAKDTINGGEGTDYVSVNTNIASVAASMASKWVDVEGLTFANAAATANAGTLDVSAYANIDLFKFQGATSATAAATIAYTADQITVTNLTSAEDLTFTGFWGGALGTAGTGIGADAAGRILTLNAKTAFDAVNITLEGASFIGGAGEHGADAGAGSTGGSGAEAADFDVTGKTITIESIGDAANSIIGGAGGNGGASTTNNTAGAAGADAITMTAGQQFVFEGTQDLTIWGGKGGAGGAGSGTGAVGAAGTDGMGFSASVEIDARGFEGKLKISGSASGDKIVGGKNDDTIYGGSGGDFLTGGEGADTFVFKAQTDSTINANVSNMDTITDFMQGTDKIGVTAEIKAAVGAADGVKVITVASTTELTLGALLTANTGGGNALTDNGAALVVVTDGAFKGSYLVIDATSGVTAEAFNAASDYCIQLNGVTTLTASDFVANA